VKGAWRESVGIRDAKKKMMISIYLNRKHKEGELKTDPEGKQLGGKGKDGVPAKERGTSKERTDQV